MKDLGTASVFFITFLVIAFMRSGSIRTIILVLAAAALGAFLLMQFMPHITNRFEAWRPHVRDYADTSGYQQTRVLMVCGQRRTRLALAWDKAISTKHLLETAIWYLACFAKKWAC